MPFLATIMIDARNVSMSGCGMNGQTGGHALLGFPPLPVERAVLTLAQRLTIEAAVRL
jgi:hypothetical protein